jgi:hypothetical protein
VVVGLLSDDQYLGDERAKAKQIKDRMANVIGSAVYYGSFSNDGSSIAPGASTSMGLGPGKKESPYESYSSNTFNKTGGSFGVGSNGSGSMTFGESVMRSLQQARKTEERTEEPPAYS